MLIFTHRNRAVLQYTDSVVIPPREEKNMAAKAEVTKTVRDAARALFQKEGRSLPQGGEAFDLSESDLTDLAARGFLRRSGSGAGDGWEVDSEVAAELGLSEYDYS